MKPARPRISKPRLQWRFVRMRQTTREAVRAEGTPAIQDAWYAVEEHIDYAYRREGGKE